MEAHIHFRTRHELWMGVSEMRGYMHSIYSYVNGNIVNDNGQVD